MGCRKADILAHPKNPEQGTGAAGAGGQSSDMQVVRSLAFTSFLFIWTFCYATMLVLIGGLLPFPRRFAFASAWARVTLWMLGAVCRLTYCVEGKENLPQGNHIALWKHSSSWETIAMSVIFPQQVWVLKRELEWIPVVGWAIKLLHAIAIDRGSGRAAVSQVLEQGRQRLAEGDWIMVYPEGTRMAPGATRKYGVSGALLATETGKLIFPVAHNAGYFWPRRGLRKKAGCIRVVIGPPIDCAGREPRAVNEDAQRWIEAQVAHLSAQAASSETAATSPPNA